jgi:ABC-type anion transport system duplicated permease subunit
MSDIGKLLILLGVILVVAGALILLAGRLGFRGLPGDISYQGSHVRVYFPIVTCIVLSIVLTAIFWLWNWLSRK